MAINDYLQGIDNATSGEKADVKTATDDLANLQVGAGNLPAALKDALNKKLNNNKDIIDQQSQTMQNYFNSASQAREKYKGIWDPFKKAALVQQERSMALRPYDTLSGVLENRMGTVNELVQTGIQGWQGLMNAAGTKLDSAKTALATRLQSYLSAVGQQEAADALGFQIAQAKEASRQFELNYGLESRKIDVNESQFAQEMGLKKTSLGSGGSSTGGSGKNGAYTTEDIKGIADGLIANGTFTAQDIAAVTNDKNINAVWSEINRQRTAKAVEDKKAEELNRQADANKRSNSLWGRIFGGNTSAPAFDYNNQLKFTPIVDPLAKYKTGK